VHYLDNKVSDISDARCIHEESLSLALPEGFHISTTHNTIQRFVYCCVQILVLKF